MTSAPGIAALNEEFGLDGLLSFEGSSESGGLIRAVITTPAATATVYLQGAHLAQWQPAGQAPVLFLSEKSGYKQGKAIRGGVPIIFPWFGDRQAGKPGPAHGFVRAAEWTLAFAALIGDDLRLTFTFAPTEATRALGFDHFRVAYELTIGRTLTMQLTIANDAPTPLLFEEALHTYYAVGDVRRSSITGLGGASFLDKRDGGKQKTQVEDPLILKWTTDRVYVDCSADCILEDPVLKRRITVAKTGSATTIVWNPWSELTPSLADMDPDAWPGMLCIEGGNAGPNAITLAPGESHTLRSVVTVGPF